jgi:hypothetical protein
MGCGMFDYCGSCPMSLPYCVDNSDYKCCSNQKFGFCAL